MSHRVGKELYDAIELNDITKVKELLHENVYMYYEDPRKRLTGMDMACSCGYFQIVRLLIKKKYDINRLNKDGATSLFYALLSENDKKRNCFEYLLLNNANPNIKDKGGLTVLHLAIMHNLEKHIIILLNNGASIDIPYSEFNFHTFMLCMQNKKYLRIFPLFMVSNYWVFNRIRNTPAKEIDIIRNKTLYLINQLKRFIDMTKKDNENINKQIEYIINNNSNLFESIKMIEKNKERFINNIYNYSTYQSIIIYNLSMIKMIKCALAEANEYMIIACQDALSCIMKSKMKRLKHYTAIRCIGKIGELKQKLKYYEEQHNKTLEFMNKKNIELLNIGNIVNNRCNQMITRQQLQMIQS